MKYNFKQIRRLFPGRLMEKMLRRVVPESSIGLNEADWGQTVQDILINWGQKTMNAFRATVLAVLMSLGASAAQAVTFTYDFYMPELLGWPSVSDAFVGSTSVLRVELDNGGSSNLNQDYTIGDITGLQLISLEGTTYSSPFFASPTSSGDTSALIITTDAFGAATLDVTLATTDGAVFASGGGYFLQLATSGTDVGTGSCTYAIGTPAGTGYNCAQNEVFPAATGQLVSAVPLPAGFLLLPVAFGFLFGMRRLGKVA